MEKNIRLVKKILEAVQKHEGPGETGFSQAELGLQDIDPHVYAFHTKKLTEEGCIRAERLAGIADEYPTYQPYSLTDTGKELLFQLSTKGKLKKATEFLAKAGKDVAVSVLVEYLKRLSLP